MSLREMPSTFTCDACQKALHVDLWCQAMPDTLTLLCVQCCGCPAHRADDPGGHAVFAAGDGWLTWRGLG